MTVPTQILKAYDKAAETANLKLPYVYGGGDNPEFAPSEGIHPVKGIKGYDCSKAVSAVLHAADLLSEPLGTKELLDWGDAGQGTYMTLWVINNSTIQHAALQFKLPEHPTNRWWMASHTGTIIGWFTLPDNWVEVPFSYTARRRP